MSRRPPAAPRVLLAMKASSWASPSCSSRAIRRRSSVFACSFSVRWAAQLESASSRKWPRATQRSTHSSGMAAPRVAMASTPCSSPSGQTGTQAPCVTPDACRMARTVGPTRSLSSWAATGWQRLHRLPKGGMLVQRPALLDDRSELVELGVNDHHVVFDPEVRRSQDLRPVGRRDTEGELRAERSDLRRLRQLDELACCAVEGLFVPEHPLGARLRLFEAAAYDVNGNRQHGGDGGGEEQPAQRRGPELRRGERHGQDGGQHEHDADHRLPTLAVEGDTHDRHEQQEAGSAPHAA